MNNDYVFHAGEATVLAAEGQFTDAMPEILIGRTNGPVGQAFANMMAQSKGHTAMFAIRACIVMVRPVTIDDRPRRTVSTSGSSGTQRLCQRVVLSRRRAPARTIDLSPPPPNRHNYFLRGVLLVPFRSIRRRRRLGVEGVSQGDLKGLATRIVVHAP